MAPPLHLRTVVSHPFDENTYLAWLPGHTDCLVIDPGLQPELILASLRDEELTVAAILNTHGHVDHIAGNAAIKEAFPDAPLIIGINEEAMLADPLANLSAFTMTQPLNSPPADRIVSDGDEIEVAGLTLQVFEIPGHSPGHVVFVCKDLLPAVVFGGDVLFRGSIGRTDFPGGSLPTLLDGIRNKLFTLSPDTLVYPGHGPVTTIDHERKTNPFVQ